MTSKELASLLDKREYAHEITTIEKQAAKAAGLVVVCPYSDDNVELRGAIDDELSAYNGTTVYLTEEGLVENECRYDDCPHFLKMQEQARTIRAIWNDSGKPCWSYETSIPHETFEIMEDGELFAIGIVFALKDAVLEKAKS